MVKLNDSSLIEFIMKSCTDIEFISKETIKKYIIKFDNKKDLKEIFNPLDPDSIDILDLWESLLIDAIKYLKWHDSKEFPGSQPMNREKAYNMISEGSLGVIKLKEYFKVFIEFERLLYGAEQFYRDHVYHIIRVWLTGQFIIKEYMNKDFKIFIDEDRYNLAVVDEKDKPSGMSELSIRNDNSLYKGEEAAIWCVIALTHDLGYPLSKFEKINDIMKKMVGYFAKTGLEEFSFAFPLQNQFINDAILKYMSSKIVQKGENNVDIANGNQKYKTHIQAKFYLKFSRSFERFDHGLISCIVLTKNLIYFLETNYDWNPTQEIQGKVEARQFVLRREILRAIASHTCPEIYYLNPNTFSFILLLSDELQFWSRPTLDLISSGEKKDYEVILNQYNEKEVSFNIEFNGKDTGKKKDSLIGFFKNKVNMFNTILRIAADYEKRKFTLRFKIVDETNNVYEFESTPREHPVLKLNGKEIKYTELNKIAPILEDGEKYLKTNEIYGRYPKITP